MNLTKPLAAARPNNDVQRVVRKPGDVKSRQASEWDVIGGPLEKDPEDQALAENDGAELSEKPRLTPPGV